MKQMVCPTMFLETIPFCLKVYIGPPHNAWDSMTVQSPYYLYTLIIYEIYLLIENNEQKQRV